jgi:hypothetical protein
MPQNTVCAGSRQFHGQTQRTQKMFAQRKRKLAYGMIRKNPAYTIFCKRAVKGESCINTLRRVFFIPARLFSSPCHKQLVMTKSCVYLSRGCLLRPAYIKASAAVVSAHPSITVDKHFNVSWFALRRPLDFHVIYHLRRLSHRTRFTTVKICAKMSQTVSPASVVCACRTRFSPKFPCAMFRPVRSHLV